MKSEREGDLIKYAIALRSKMYYLDIPGKNKSDRKINGITYAVKLKVLTSEHYLDSILGQTLWIQNQTRIQVKHNLYKLQECKNSLCANDTKRYITENPLYTKALRHWKKNF